MNPAGNSHREATSFYLLNPSRMAALSTIAETVASKHGVNSASWMNGSKERPIACKLGIGFCDHNHERKEPPADYIGMLNFA